MSNTDTIHLLKECDAGSKMAVSSIDDVMDKVNHKEMREILTESRKHHEKLGNDLHAMLNELGEEEKDPSVMAKGMSWMKTNVKLSMDGSDKTVADLMIDGCDMGIKSLYKYLNQYPVADKEAKGICKRLIDIEDELRRSLYSYL